MKTKIIVLSFTTAMITGCFKDAERLTHGYKMQLSPEKQISKSIEHFKVTYILPKNAEHKKPFQGLVFNCKKWGDDRRRESILANYSGDIMIVERRVDNGVTGSGRVYEIKVEKKIGLDNIEIALIHKNERTYQDGIIQSFPLPDFNIENFFSTSYYEYDFEINSLYSVESTRANFNRILGGGNNYKIKLANADAIFKVNIFPYRSGSKLHLESQIFNMKSSNGIIDVNKNIKELREKITNIIHDRSA